MIYNSSVISDKQMMQWGREAFADAVSAGRVKAGVTRNGMGFRQVV